MTNADLSPHSLRESLREELTQMEALYQQEQYTDALSRGRRYLEGMTDALCILFGFSDGQIAAWAEAENLQSAGDRRYNTGTKPDLFTKLRFLEESGHFGKPLMSAMHQLRRLGNDSAHFDLRSESAEDKRGTAQEALNHARYLWLQYRELEQRPAPKAAPAPQAPPAPQASRAPVTPVRPVERPAQERAPAYHRSAPPAVKRGGFLRFLRGLGLLLFAMLLLLGTASLFFPELNLPQKTWSSLTDELIPGIDQSIRSLVQGNGEQKPPLPSTKPQSAAADSAAPTPSPAPSIPSAGDAPGMAGSAGKNGITFSFDQPVDARLALHYENTSRSSFMLGWVQPAVAILKTDVGEYSYPITDMLLQRIIPAQSGTIDLYFQGMQGNPQQLELMGVVQLNANGLPVNNRAGGFNLLLKVRQD